ncbi:hypothetical protein [Ornithinibacillus sp. FSL M8-0202]|uniref:hypothetical protein n=1 Tax=Ornithinibacillus sp. FSL M8-0202 TaxID=2921616 RepID=UPI0030CB0A7E
MNIFDKELHIAYEKGYLEGKEYSKRRLYRVLVEAIYKGYSKQLIELLIKSGEFHENEIQEAYNYLKDDSYPISPLSGVSLGKFIDWRIRSEIVIPTEKMTNHVYFKLTSKAIRGNITEYINSIVGFKFREEQIMNDMNHTLVFLKELLKEYKTSDSNH